MMCDYKYCPKVYHLACLGRDKMPREKWFCPWHHCVVCAKKAVYHCIHCPNGYCESHNILKDHDELGSICDEHKDDIPDLIKFYRRVGGIEYLCKDPNYPNEARVKMLAKMGKENSEPVYSEDDMPLKIVARKKDKNKNGKRKTLSEKYSEKNGMVPNRLKSRPFGQANPFQVGDEFASEIVVEFTESPEKKEKVVKNQENIKIKISRKPKKTKDIKKTENPRKVPFGQANPFQVKRETIGK